LRSCEPALDRFGIPLVASGNFAYAFKLRDKAAGKVTGVRCFRGLIADRAQRYALISRHLASHANASLARFEFDPEGILIGGARFPIVVMEWIEGPTLDLYIGQLIANKAALQQLAEEWLAAIDGLRTSQLAHGDLQHGNVIVQEGRVRLIDLDGMYVPAMRGWNSSEIGHPHFQHPRRDLSYFDGSLDNFSALVIYLSILALAEAPDLWQQFHDENLIFTKADFADPGASRLFAAVRKLGQTHSRLCGALESAAKGAPAATPRLLDLVPRKSKLPSWMTAAPDVKIEVRTRESTAPPPAPTPAPVPWRPAPPAAAPRPALAPPLPANPPAAFNFSAIPGIQARRFSLDWGRIHRSALSMFFTRYVPVIWLAIVLLLSYRNQNRFLDLIPFPVWLIVFFGSATFAYLGAIRDEKKWQKIRMANAMASSWPLLRSPQMNAPGHGNRVVPLFPRGGPVIALRLDQTYHRPQCNEVQAPAPKSTISFNSAWEARRSGFVPCSICHPGV
jgi:hypothetical protein